LYLPLSDLSQYPLYILTVFEGDPWDEFGIQFGLPPQRPSSLFTHEGEDVLGHPLVSVVVWSELELDLVHFPQEDEDHSQFFR
jgi:hypothetical protein